MGRATIANAPTVQVPSGNSLTYCRLCFSTRPCKKIVSREDALNWIDYIQRTVGLEMKAEEDAPFAICFGCKATLESVEQFRYTCRLHDTALRQFRGQAAPSGNTTDQPSLISSDNTDGGESSNLIDTVEIPPTTDEESADDSKDSFHSPAVSSNSPVANNMCLVCDMKLPSVLEYRRHMKKTHGKVGGIVTCPLCKRRFRKDLLFQIHVLKHTDRPKTFLGWTQLQGKQKKCRLCKKVFPTGQELGAHEAEQHGLRFECRLCCRRFATENDKNVHKILHLATQGQGLRKNFKCKICSRVFPNRHCLNIHVKKHEKCYMCLACDLKIVRVEAYMEHQATVHHSNPTLDECSECKMAFNSRTELLNHLNLIHVAYDPQALANDEFSDSDGGGPPNGSVTEEQQPGQSHQPPEEPETVSVSSDDDEDDDFPMYMEENDDEDDGDDEQESTSREVAPSTTNRLDEGLTLDEAPHVSGFDLYGTAFQPQISESLIQELSD